MQLTLELQGLIKALVEAQLNCDEAESEYNYSIKSPGYESDVDYTKREKEAAEFGYEMAAIKLDEIGKLLICGIKREFITDEVRDEFNERQFKQAA